jgi:hypothetical protein
VFLIYAFMTVNFLLRTPLLCPIGSNRLCFYLH